jgi:hypothetical protein
VVVIERISWRPWPRSNVTWAGGKIPARASEQSFDALVQGRLVVFDGEDVFPVSFQDPFHVVPVDVQCISGDHDPREVSELFAPLWWGTCDLVEQGDHLGLLPGVLGNFPLADHDSFSVGERGEQPDLARPGIDLLPGALECLAIPCQAPPGLRGHDSSLEFRVQPGPDDSVRLISVDVFDGAPDRGLAGRYRAPGDRVTLGTSPGQRLGGQLSDIVRD